MAITVAPSTVAAALVTAAQKYNVPIENLVGIYGQETGFGSDSTTSSAGAIGPFQFLPSTAKQYGYPLTNTPTAAQFGQQANAAAAYLSALYKQHGNWNSAIQAYSGGGYGQAQVNAQVAKMPDSLKSALIPAVVEHSGTFGVGIPGVGAAPGPGAAVNAAAGAVSSIPQAISNVWGSAVGDAKYAAVMVGVLLLGALMIFHAFSGGAGARERLVIA